MDSSSIKSEYEPINDEVAGCWFYMVLIGFIVYFQTWG